MVIIYIRNISVIVTSLFVIKNKTRLIQLVRIIYIYIYIYIYTELFIILYKIYKLNT